MATLSLNEYVTQVEALLQQESYDQVIALCQHALRSYPKCVDFYRMLGQACLETERPDDAADMFRRVLGADPQNFVARVGLGVVAEGMGAADEALWQWDRALELEPHHAVVREEWRRVRIQRDRQMLPARSKLNRAGLGYVYLRGEQYERAAAEFRTVLNVAPKDSSGKHDRFDLQIALAEALYRGGRQREASELCKQVLTALPNALKPNLMLGDIYHESGREEEGQALFQRASSVDPENAVAARLLNSPVRLLRKGVTLEEPEGIGILSLNAAYKQGVDAGGGMAALPRPRAGRLPNTATSDDDASADVPEWLKALRAQSPAEPVAATPALDTNDAPSWLKELGATALSPEPASQVDNSPVAVTQVAVPLPPPISAPLQIAEPPAPSAPVSAEPLDEPISVTSDASVLPDWLQQLRGTVDSNITAQDELPASPAEAAVWVDDSPAEAESFADESPVSEVATVEAEPADAMPEWLTELRRPEDAAAAFISVETESSAPAEADEPETATAWLSEEPIAAELIAPSEPMADDLPVVAPVASVEPPVAEWMPPPAREAVSYLDEAMAPLSIEAQVAPSGEAEHRARLDLARVMKDIDVDSALSLYELMDGASESLLQQAIDDVSELTGASPRARDVLARLKAGTALAAASRPAETQPEPEEDLDDAAMPQSLEEQLAPTSHAQYEARLGLARMLVDLEVDSALGQYEQMEGANPALLRLAVDEVAAIVLAHPGSERAGEVLELLQRGLPADADIEPSVLEVIEETPDSDSGPQAAIDEPPSVPAEESPVSWSPPVADEPPPDLSGMVLPESARPKLGTAAFQARLDLARALKFIDVDAALNLYELMVGCNDALRMQALGDLEGLSAKYPRAKDIIAELSGKGHSETALTDWFDEPQPAATLVETVAEQEAVVIENADDLAPVPIVDETMAEEPAAKLIEQPADTALVAESDSAPAVPIVDEMLAEAVAPEPAVPVDTLVVENADDLAPVPIVDEALAEEPAAEFAESPGEMVAEELTSATPVVEAALTDEPVTEAMESLAPLPVESVAAEEAPATESVPIVDEAFEDASVAEVAAPAETVTVLAAEAEATVPIVDETIAEEPLPPAAPLREAVSFLSDSSAPLSIEAQEAPSGEAEHQARLELARALREIDIHESAGQYKALIDDNMLLPVVITDLQGWLKAEPNERVLRTLLADALTRTGRLAEAVEQYRLLI